MKSKKAKAATKRGVVSAPGCSAPKFRPIELVKPYLKLADAAEKLIEIVEGVTSERWVGERGQRLKDTSAWVEFYCAYSPIRYAKEDAVEFLLRRSRGEL